MNFLPIIRGAVSGDMDKVRIFLEAIASVINNCKQSDKTILEYKGWALDNRTSASTLS